MTMARISEKGQITLPAKARRKLGMEPRSQVEIEVRDKEIVIRRARSIRDVCGAFKDLLGDNRFDWETERAETERIVAEEVAREDQR